ncbi:MAG: PKD domain-containing protein, partial [Bacteroidota bacterium]
MKKQTSTPLHFSLLRYFGFLMVAWMFTTSLQAQSITCNSLVHITLDENCQAVVGADQILEGTYSNYSQFTVAFTNSGLPVLLGPGDVGQTYSVTVTSPTGNSCWGNILVEDKIAPTIVCTDLVLNCTDPLPTEPNSVFDACDPDVAVTFQDNIQDNGCSGTFEKVITRTYTATDDSGNSSTCVQTISIERATLAGVAFPSDVIIDCQDSSNPTNAGEPTGTSCFNLDFTYDDVVVPICEGSFKILRTWTVLDWCTNQSLDHTQIVKVLDTTGPTIQPLADVTISTTSNSCTGNAQLPAIGLTDDCSGGGFDVHIETPLGIIFGNGGMLIGAPLGNHTITYFATDACGNESFSSLTLTVVDLVAPIAICDEFTKVGLGSNGNALVEAITFDDGSYDNCGIVEYQARRMDNPNCPGNDATAFGDFVPFSCCDIGSTVMVEFRVKDEAGNTNSCMVEVEVEDKLDPIIICPANKTISCEDDFEDLALTGEAVATDNCPDVNIMFNDISVNIGCGGVGTVTRVWTATDAQGNTTSCIQIITLENDDPFYINPNNEQDPTDDVTWPLDYTINTCGAGLEPDQLPTPYNRPIIEEDACDFIASSFEDTYLPIQEPACVKILRKWIIIDWCQAGQNANPTVPGPGVWHYTQIIKVENSTSPVIDNLAGPDVVENFEANCGSTTATFEVHASDDCTATADLTYSWAFSTGLSGTGKSASGAFANGSYTLTFTVEDGCGNTTEIVKDFVVMDKKKPTPVCIFGLATVIMPSSGNVMISATDFETGSSYDNCTPYEDLQFSFSSDVTDIQKTISCTDVSVNGLYEVQIWVTDNAGNQDYCTTIIQIQDPNGACGLIAATISGSVATEYQDMVEDVTVDLNNTTMAPVLTDASGDFNFGQLPMGLDYTVTPEKNMNYTNGVTTYDIALIARHALGVELLDSPYKVIAADANNTGMI